MGLTNFAEAGLQCNSIFLTESEFLILKFSGGARNLEDVDGLGRRINELNAKEKEDWILALGTVYRKVPKQNTNPTAPVLIGGRRLLDRLLTITEDYNAKFIREASFGKSGREAYDLFMKRQQDLFGIKYGADEIISIVEMIQSEVRALNKTGYPAKILLSGSFVNGKANVAESDVDISVSEVSLVKMVQSLKDKINDIVRVADPNSKLSIETHGQAAVFFGRFNPVVIEITAEKIELLVFPAASGSTAKDLQVGPPARYAF